ncbi:MAG TPA: OmpH family outer membrane protein [Pyrinomonadaceae bacterium]|nr:OmpH family outer membrane protein [Pyrinomonadaceae bacterium]
MKKFNLIAVSLMFAAIFAVSAAAQTTGDKIGLIGWDAFGDPTKGIKKYATALTTLDKEFEVLNNELRTMGTKYQTLQKEIVNMQETYQKNPQASPFKPEAIQAKIDELGQLERDIKKKQEDGAAKYKSRYATVIGPIQDDILKAMSEYAQKNGYAVILDGGKLEQAGILLGFTPKADVTQDFITFYNARPATASTTTK